MVAKLIVKGKDRADAIAVGERALREFHIGGVASTVPFHQFMLKQSKFLQSDYDLGYIDALTKEGCRFEIEKV